MAGQTAYARRSIMSLLIDGYNVMFAVGLVPRKVGPGTMQRARFDLLKYLVEHLDPDELASTVLVFDAKRRLGHHESETEYRGIRVLFATEYDEADDLIERLIRLESTPKNLVVVSSDLRLRTAASRRRARAIKSEDWVVQLEDRRDARKVATDVELTDGSRRATPLKPDDVDRWLTEFGLTSAPPGTQQAHSDRLRHDDRRPAAPQGDDTDSSQDNTGSTDSRREAAQRAEAEDSGWGPFPPGYGDDVLNDCRDDDRPA